MSGLPFHHKLIIDINNDIIATGDHDTNNVNADIDSSIINDINNINDVIDTNDIIIDNDNSQLISNHNNDYIDEDDDDEEYQYNEEMYEDDDEFEDDSEDEDYYEPSNKRTSYGEKRNYNIDRMKHLTPQERKLREEQLAIKKEKARERRHQRQLEADQEKERKRKRKRELRSQGLDARGNPLPSKKEQENPLESNAVIHRSKRLYHEEFCFSCGCAGLTVKCDACPKVYHYECLNELGFQYVPSPESKWICPWHSCNKCKKCPVKNDKKVVWDDAFVSYACTHCTVSFCDSCFDPEIKSGLDPRPNDISLLRRRGYLQTVREPNFFICNNCEPKIDDDIEKMFGSVHGNNISHLPPEDSDSDVDVKTKKGRKSIEQNESKKDDTISAGDGSAYFAKVAAAGPVTKPQNFNINWSDFGKEILRGKCQCYLSKTGKLLLNFDSIKETAMALRIPSKELLLYLASGSTKPTRGYIFKLDENSDENNVVDDATNISAEDLNSPVSCFDALHGRLLHSFEKLGDIANVLPECITVQDVFKNCKKQTTTYMGMTWKFGGTTEQQATPLLSLPHFVTMIETNNCYTSIETNLKTSKLPEYESNLLVDNKASAPSPKKVVPPSTAAPSERVNAGQPTTILECISLKDGTVVKTFSCVKDAAKWAKMKSNGINKVLRRENQSGGGFFWRQRQVYGPDVLAAIIANEARKEAGLAPDMRIATVPFDLNVPQMKADGWAFDKSEKNLIGHRLRKFYDDYGYTDGTIIAYLSGDKNNGLELFYFQHDDGDCEDLKLEEVHKCRGYFQNNIVDDPENPSNSISKLPRDTGRRNHDCDCRVECYTPQGVALIRFNSPPAAAKELQNVISVRTIMKCCRTEGLEFCGVSWRWCFNKDEEDPIENPITPEELLNFIKKNYKGKPVYEYKYYNPKYEATGKREKRIPQEKSRDTETFVPKKFSTDSSFLRKGTNDRSLGAAGNPPDAPVPRKLPCIGNEHQALIIPECRPKEGPEYLKELEDPSEEVWKPEYCKDDEIDNYLDLCIEKEMLPGLIVRISGIYIENNRHESNLIACIDNLPFDDPVTLWTEGYDQNQLIPVGVVCTKLFSEDELLAILKSEGFNEDNAVQKVTEEAKRRLSKQWDARKYCTMLKLMHSYDLDFHRTKILMKEAFPELTTVDILREFHLFRKDDFREDYYNRTKRCTDICRLTKYDSHDSIKRIVKKADMILGRPTFVEERNVSSVTHQKSSSSLTAPVASSSSSSSSSSTTTSTTTSTATAAATIATASLSLSSTSTEQNVRPTLQQPAKIALQQPTIIAPTIIVPQPALIAPQPAIIAPQTKYSILLQQDDDSDSDDMGFI